MSQLLGASSIVPQTVDSILDIINEIGQHWLDTAKSRWFGPRLRLEVAYMKLWRENTTQYIRSVMPGLGLRLQNMQSAETEYAFVVEHYKYIKNYFIKIDEGCHRPGQLHPKYWKPTDLVRFSAFREALSDSHWFFLTAPHSDQPGICGRRRRFQRQVQEEL